MPILPNKKKWGKWPFLNKYDGLTPMEKCQVFNFLNFFFYSLKKPFFRSRISEETFSRPILPKKKEIEKMAIFRQQPWVNPFEKMSIFRLLELLLFIALKGVFSF